MYMRFTCQARYPKNNAHHEILRHCRSSSPLSELNNTFYLVEPQFLLKLGEMNVFREEPLLYFLLADNTRSTFL